MKPTLFLHQLIQSLTPGEPEGFIAQLLRGRKGENGLYLKLFQAVLAQPTYDEAEIKRQFEGTSFGKSLAFPKSHLYDQLLEFLQQTQPNASVGSTLRSILDQVELLADRGLPEQAMRIIERGLRLAQALEDAIVALQFLRLQRRQVMRLQVHELSAAMAAIDAEEARWETQLAQEQQATRLHDALYAASQEVRRKSRAADDPHLHALWDQLQALLAQPDLAFPAKVAAMRARSHYHHMREDFRAVHDAYQAEIAAWDAHPLQIQHAGLRYVRLIGQWLTSKALLGDYAGLLAQLEGLRNRHNLDQRGKAEIFQTTYTLELYYYLNAGKSQEALPLVEAVAAGLQRYDALLPPSAKLGFFYNLALVHWMSGQPSPALKWVRKIEQFEKGAVRKDIRDFAPLLEHVLHYELGNTSLLESWFRAVRYRRKSAAGPTMEGILAELLQRLLEAGSAAERQEHVQQFLQALAGYAEQPGISRLGFHELRGWAERLLG